MWEPKIARSAVFRVCAMLIRRPDDVEHEVLMLASAALFNPAVFANETEFGNLFKQVLGWSDEHVASLIEQMNAPTDEKSTES